MATVKISSRTPDTKLGESLAQLQTDTTSDFLSLIPPLYVGPDRQIQKTEVLEDFFHHDLTVKRLNEIHDWLYVAGLPMAARPLHYQLMMGRQIIITEQADLHLVWGDSGMFIKPLPRYLLDNYFWEKFLRYDKNEELYGFAFGLLQSYLWLVRYESDFKLAIDESKGPSILPPTLKWDQWRAFAEKFPLEDLNDNDACANKRYKFGELRVGRLNLICRIKYWYKIQRLIQGYYDGYQRYHNFFSDNFAWLIVIFAYVTVVLTAMQLGTTLDSLSGDKRFQRASFGFAIFSIIVPVVTVGVAVTLFVVLFTENAVNTWLVWRHRQRGQKKYEDE